MLPGLDKVKEKVEEDVSKPKTSPFEIIDKINSKSYPVWDEEVEKTFSPYMTNRFFSQFPGTIFAAAEMNAFPDLDKKLQFDFYYHKLKREKRFTKWAKGSEDKSLEIIQKHYKVNAKRAQEMKQLSESIGYDIISEIESKYGGR